MKYLLPEENSLQFMQLLQKMMSLSSIYSGNQQGNFCNHQGKKRCTARCIDDIFKHLLCWWNCFSEYHLFQAKRKKMIRYSHLIEINWKCLLAFTVYLISKFHRKTCTEKSFQMEKYQLLMMLWNELDFKKVSILK